ncbi:MAG TPA: ABC transporter ATP-binding protein [Mycobacteriales bacterium]|nr:ABC transporter ATP-binding protein [Mycobacteriales bacterium]
MSLFGSSVLRRYVLHAGLLWRAAPAASATCVALTMFIAAMRTAMLVASGRLIAALTSPVEAVLVWWWLAVTAALLLAGPLASAGLSYCSRVVSAKYVVAVCDGIIELGTRSYGLAPVEDPDTATRSQALRRAPRDWLFLAGIERTWTLLGIRLSGAGAFVIVAAWSWWAALVLLIAWQVYSRAFVRWSATLFDDLLAVTGNERRRAPYLRSILTGAATAAEVRLFGLTDWIGDRHGRAWRSALDAVWRRRTSSVSASMVAVLAPAAANGLVFAALVHDATNGALDAGALVTVAQAVLAMIAFGPQSDSQMGLARTLAGVAGITAQSEVIGPPVVSRRVRSQPLAVPVAARIELRDVTFTYPRSAQPTLQGLQLQIPAGQSVALVGLNGAGKTTLIRLLCGLYVPSTGTVRVDGCDPATDPAARQRIAVIFQEFVRYPLTLRENVGLGEEVELERALSDAGAESLLGRLRHGWDTVLSAEYDEGTDLSGGQWQRVALARALARLSAGAGVLVLDEPTSALDVRAESALFDRFLTVARGVTTLLVSHRLSSVRHADRIVVLDQGQIVEDGSHDDLMSIDGRYARLFRLQAARFATTGESAR